MGRIYSSFKKSGYGDNNNKEYEEYEVLYDFAARTDAELTLSKGDRIEIIKKENSDWFKARCLTSDEIGLVPMNYTASVTSLFIYEWYHGEADRESANRILRDTVTGHYLIRTSQRKTGSYILSVKSEEETDGHQKVRIKHHIIYEKNGRFLIFNQNYASLPELVQGWKDLNSSRYSEPIVPCVRPVADREDLTIETRDVWELDPSCVHKHKMVGSGNFGKVYLGTYINGTTEVTIAIKTLKKGSMSIEDFLDEAGVMKDLHHRNIVTLYGVCSTTDPYYIITEYMPKGSLLSVIRKYDDDERNRMNIFLLCDFALKIACGMEYLEGRNVVHRDLAARNVLLDKALECKIGDFGLAKIMENEENYVSNSGKQFPFKWSAPEVLTHRKFSTKSDVWSFAITFIEILTFGAMPYAGYSNPEASKSVIGGYRMPKPDTCTLEIFAIINNCWKSGPKDRWTFAKIHRELIKWMSTNNGYYSQNP